MSKRRPCGAARLKIRRDRIIKRDGVSCFWCDIPTVDHGYFGSSRLDANHRTIDHFIPKSRGGPDDDENLVISCLQCNHEKANLLPEEWLEVLDARAADRVERAKWKSKDSA